MRLSLLFYDKQRYEKKKGVHTFQKIFRLYQGSNIRTLKFCYKIMYHFLSKKNHIEIPLSTKIGGGLYIGHPFCITINPETVIGSNCNLHKGVTIGQENRGVRKGTPTIGNCVWIGINATIVGNVTIGDDVLIAPNSYVNCDVPSHSVVYGNPCMIKHREDATENYINRKCNL